jgi:hypothetical protein
MNGFRMSLKAGLKTLDSQEHKIQLFFRITETHWLIKIIIAQIMEERSLQQQDILHKIDLLYSKFTTFFKTTFEIEIVVSQVHDEKTDTMALKEDSLGYVDT